VWNVFEQSKRRKRGEMEGDSGVAGMWIATLVPLRRFVYMMPVRRFVYMNVATVVRRKLMGIR
jgi:hypothetical protein